MIPILSNFDIEEISNEYNLNIKCLAQQNLKNEKIKKNTHYIININKDFEMGHWVAIYIKNKKGYYFDSYGVKPSNYIIKFLKNNNIKYVYNDNDIQDYYDVSCGFYCLAFIKFMSMNRKKDINEFTKMFNNNTKNNVKILQNYFSNNF